MHIKFDQNFRLVIILWCWSLAEAEEVYVHTSRSGVLGSYMVAPDEVPKKPEAIVTSPPPTNLKTVQSFVGLTIYYQRFIPNYADVAKVFKT